MAPGHQIAAFPGGTQGGVLANNVFNGFRRAELDLGPNVTYYFSDWDPQELLTQIQQALATRVDPRPRRRAATAPLVDRAYAEGTIFTSLNKALPESEEKYASRERRPMKITAVKTVVVNARLRNWVFVRIETHEPGLDRLARPLQWRRDDGAVADWQPGHGETHRRPACSGDRRGSRHRRGDRREGADRGRARFDHRHRGAGGTRPRRRPSSPGGAPSSAKATCSARHRRGAGNGDPGLLPGDRPRQQRRAQRLRRPRRDDGGRMGGRVRRSEGRLARHAPSFQE